MFYCPNCNNIYDITKNIPSIINQTGGQESETPETVSTVTNTTNDLDKDNINIVIKNILSGKQINKSELKNITLDNLIKNTNYKRLQNKTKELVYNKISELLDNKNISSKSDTLTNTNAYFICKNCNNYEPIKPNTLITRKIYNETNEVILEDSSKFKDMSNVKCIPLTRNYICPNNKCISQTNHSKRAAKFYRIPGSFKIRYICTGCDFSWTI